MDFIDLISKRQSCRRYRSDVVPRELIDRCIEAARLAPSACNSQPWRFIVIDREPLRTKVAQECCTGLYSLNRFALEAPVLVAIVTERSRYAARLGGMFRRVQYSLIDIGIAGQHFDLQAAELGLGACWLGWFHEKALKKLLGLSRRDHIDVMFTLGYSADPDIRPKKRFSIEQVREFRD